MSSCSGHFADLLRQAERESFNNQVLQEIEDVKDRLKRRLQTLMIQGDFRNANDEINELKAELEKLEKTEKLIKKLVET